MIGQTFDRLLALGSVTIVALVVSLALIILLRPWLERHALARPNARSSHQHPTPQGGGIAVVAATLAAASAGIALVPAGLEQYGSFLTLTAATGLLAIVGAIDDIRTLPTAPRFLWQCAAVGMVIAAFPADLHVLSFVPWWFERVLMFFGLVWFVNLVNFMDGIDWMTATEVVSITTALVLLSFVDAIEFAPAVLAAALLGAILGFAPFNKPVARLFLGDVGSLPIGLLLGWFLLHLAGKGHLAAAILLPLYYVADATVTLIRRIAAGEPFWQPHRKHFYQRATDNGFAVSDIIARVFAVNLALVALALITVLAPGRAASLLAFAAGAAIVGWQLVTFARGKR